MRFTTQKQTNLFTKRCILETQFFAIVLRLNILDEGRYLWSPFFFDTDSSFFLSWNICCEFQLVYACFYMHLLGRKRWKTIYNGDLNSKLVQYLNVPKQFAPWMVRYSVHGLNSKLKVCYSRHGLNNNNNNNNNDRLHDWWLK